MSEAQYLNALAAALTIRSERWLELKSAEASLAAQPTWPERQRRYDRARAAHEAAAVRVIELQSPNPKGWAVAETSV